MVFELKAGDNGDGFCGNSIDFPGTEPIEWVKLD